MYIIKKVDGIWKTMIGFLMRKVFLKKMTDELTEIVLTERGFSINEPFHAKPKSFDWSEIINIQFSEKYNEVIIEIKEREIILKNNKIGWYEFIQNIPSNFSNFDFNHAKYFMDSLKPCGVCGIIAVKENKCLFCETIPWNDAMPQTKIEYLKLKQSELFSVWIKEGIEIKKVAKPEHGFKADKNWKLYI